MSVHHVEFELSFVDLLVGPSELPGAMLLAPLEVTLVFRTIRPDFLAEAVLLVLGPGALIGVAVARGEDSEAVVLPSHPLPLVVLPTFIDHQAFATAEPILPGALVVKALGGEEAPDPALLPVLEVALVDVAVLELKNLRGFPPSTLANTSHQLHLFSHLGDPLVSNPRELLEPLHDISPLLLLLLAALPLRRFMLPVVIPKYRELLLNLL